MNKDLDIDETLETVHEGQRARIVRGSVDEYLIDQEEDILNRMVAAYRADGLTDDMMRGNVGEISALRAFREYIESTIRRGVMEAEKELGNG
jgi:uncharacterized membrane protein YebE (DUF533 family)|tara:strand:+ start:142 stop:417 length:276 start_codon:yes stop_codon:yes gene_type:complete